MTYSRSMTNYSANACCLAREFSVMTHELSAVSIVQTINNFMSKLGQKLF